MLQSKSVFSSVPLIEALLPCWTTEDKVQQRKAKMFPVFGGSLLEFSPWTQASCLSAGRMPWPRLRLIYTIWKPQLLFSYTGDSSLQSHGCCEPMACWCCTVRSPAQCVVSLLDLCCVGGILYCVLGLFSGKELEADRLCLCTFLRGSILKYICLVGTKV